MYLYKIHLFAVQDLKSVNIYESEDCGSNFIFDMATRHETLFRNLFFY